MKRLTICVILALGVCAFQLSAQSEKEIRKDRKEQVKLSKKLLNEKASKDARKQAKELKKEGWTVGAGSLSLEKQIDRSMLRQMEQDAYGKSLYLIGEANSVGETIDAARFSAMEIAKVNLVQRMEQEIAGGIEDALANSQISADDAASAMKTVGSFRTIIQHKISGLEPLVSIYRSLINRNYESRVVLSYPRAEMIKAMKQSLRDELLKDGKRTLEDVDCIVNGICKISE